MKEMLKKLSDKLKILFGYGIMITLFVGGLTFFGYFAAVVIGGDIAVLICEIIYQKIVPVMIYANTVMVLLGLFTMYLAGEKALTANNSKASKK
jgi:hypothetical protein